MKGTDRIVLISLAIVGLLAAFYFMVLSPKREEASKLGDEVTQLQASIDQQNQIAQEAEQTRKEFPRHYSRLVVLGKAVPEDADTASMLVQLSGIAGRTGVDFRGIALGQGAGEGSSTTSASSTTTAAATGTATPAASGTTTTPSSGTAPSSSTSGTTGTTTTPSSGTSGDSASGSAASTSPSPAPAPATEAAAATLPIGAKVGPAGLPTLPYDLSFTGTFFDVANFMAGVDSMVETRDGQVAANGRLLTVDGFSLSKPTLGANPKLQVAFSVTSYTVPAEQGLTGGAAPGGPAPAPTQPNVTPVVDQ
jgi:Tfp pilus assembly protein PilO